MLDENIIKFLTLLAEAYNYKLTKPRARIYKSLIKKYLHQKTNLEKLFEIIVTDDQIEYFPTIAVILRKSGFKNSILQGQWQREIEPLTNELLWGESCTTLDTSKLLEPNSMK